MFSAQSAFSKNADPFDWNLRVGVNGLVSSGISDSDFYYKPYTKASVSYGIFTFSGGASASMDYPVSSGEGDYKDISVCQFNGEADVYTFHDFFVNTRFDYYTGGSDYSGYAYYFSGGHEFDKFSVMLEYGRRHTQYTFDLEKLRSDSFDIMGELSFFISDSASVDFSYTYSSFDSDEPDYSYNRHLVRGGFMLFGNRNLFLMAGGSAGFDSTDYLITGVDAAVNIRIMQKLKLTLMDIFYYYYSSNSDNQQVQTGDYTEEAGSSYSSNQIMAGIELSFN